MGLLAHPVLDMPTTLLRVNSFRLQLDNVDNCRYEPSVVRAISVRLEVKPTSLFTRFIHWRRHRT
jgi:hypothetical protein